VFAILSQAFLALIALVTCFLVYLLFSRTSKLECDPDSLAQVMAMSDSKYLQKLFRSHDGSSDKALATALAPIDFALERQPRSRHPTVEVVSVEENIKFLDTRSRPNRTSLRTCLT
jgi:hypothetical protein